MLAMLCFGLEWKIVTDSIEAEKKDDAAHGNRRGRDASDSSGKGVMQECRPSNHGKEAYKVRWVGSDVWGEELRSKLEGEPGCM